MDVEKISIVSLQNDMHMLKISVRNFVTSYYHCFQCCTHLRKPQGTNNINQMRFIKPEYSFIHSL